MHAANDLQLIKVSVVPASEPDSETVIEERRLDRASKSTPTDRLCRAHEASLGSQQRENGRLHKEISRLRKEINELRKGLDQIRPDYAAIKQASHTNSLTDVLGLTCVSLGSISVSVAQFPQFGPYSPCLCVGGAVSAIIGSIMLVYVKLFCWPKK